MCVTIPIISDDFFEPQEVFSVVLENLDGTTPTDPSRATIVIIDDDCESCEYNMAVELVKYACSYFFTAVIVGFNASSYVATEGQPAVVCMQVIDGDLESTVTFSLTTTGVTGGNR